MAIWLKGFSKEKFGDLSKASMETPYCWKRTNDSAFKKGDIVYLHTLLKDSKPLGKDSQFLFQMYVTDSTKADAYLVKVKYIEKDSLFVSKLLEQELIHDRRVLVGVSDKDRPDLKDLFDYVQAEFNAPDYPDEEDIGKSTFPEGGKTKVTVNRYERSPEARAKCIELYGLRCYACTMSFEHTYGEFAKDFIHVHHIKPLHEIGERYQVSPKDLRPVCPNCHAMLHKTKDGEAISIDDLKRYFKERLDNPLRYKLKDL